METFGTRANGSVTHLVKTVETFGVRSVCGRYVTPSETTARPLCGTCRRIRPTVSIGSVEASRRPSHGFLEDAGIRKADRESRIRSTMCAPTGELHSWRYTLTREELDRTLEKIAKINLRCSKRGIPGGLRVEYREETRKETRKGLSFEFIEYPTEITGIAPVIPGWEFMATIDHDMHAGLIVRAYPGMGDVDRSLIREGWCDHCQTARLRNVTYVVRNVESGEQVQVGSSCIKDFTGWTALPYSFDKDAASLSEGFGFSYPEVTTATALAVAWACVKHYGYVRAGDEGSTRGLVSDVIWPPRKISDKAKAALESLEAYSQDMYGKASELRAWIASDEFPGSNDFTMNLKALSSADMVSSKNLGTLCYAPEAWSRHCEKSLVRKVKASKAVSEYVGEIGEQWELSLTVESARYIASQYGSTTLFTLLDSKGNIFKWFASASWLDEWLGKTVTLKATVKKHGVYSGSQETGITRCKLIDTYTSDRMVKAAPIDVKAELSTAFMGELDITEVYMMDGDYYRVRTSKGTAYAQRHTADGWTYSRGDVHRIETCARPLSAKQASAFGHAFGACVYCHRALSDTRSTAVGYGAECAGNHGLPWG